jgi:uncharacterized membrane protein YdjX (TVP38/TMEM64 family)
MLVMLVALAGGFWMLRVSDYLTIEQLKANREILLGFSRQHYELSSMIFIFLYLSTAFFAPGVVVLSLASGFLSGVVIGTVYILVASVFGACAAFWLARRFFGTQIQDRYREELHWFNREVFRHGRYTSSY